MFMGVLLLVGKTVIIFIQQVPNDLCNGSAVLFLRYVKRRGYVVIHYYVN